MTSKKREFYYWDSCVLISYLSASSERSDNIEAVFDYVARHTNVQIVTSSISIAEVIMTEEEKASGDMDPLTEVELRRLWYETGILVVEQLPPILHLAVKLQRSAKANGVGSFKPLDSIHLATALWMEKHHGIVREVHTYEPKWINRFASLVSSLTICEPYPPGPTLG